jgi:hypothetical protein
MKNLEELSLKHNKIEHDDFINLKNCHLKTLNLSSKIIF